MIQGAYAVKQLRSGDVEVMMTNQAIKDKALNQGEIAGCKVLRQDYPVEVSGVPLTTPIKHGKGVENDEVIKEICTAIKRVIPDMAINRLRWLHDEKGHEERLNMGKKRGNIIVSLPTQALQMEVTRKGLVIGAEWFEARLYSHSLEMKRCYKCQGWGHTQGGCGKQERCGECAGNHPLRECLKERVSCINCGKPHRAWQKRVCTTFQAYMDDTKKRRIEMVMRTAAVRNAINNSQPGPQPQPMALFKRPVKRPLTQYTSEQTQEEKRGRGRPSNIETAARDQSQSRLHLSTNPQAPQGSTSAYPVIISSSYPVTLHSQPSTYSSTTEGTTNKPQNDPEPTIPEDFIMGTPHDSDYEL